MPKCIGLFAQAKALCLTVSDVNQASGLYKSGACKAQARMFRKLEQLALRYLIVCAPTIGNNGTDLLQ